MNAITSNSDVYGLPLAQLEKDQINTFYPKVIEELSKKAAHQNDGRTNRITKEYGYSFFKMEQEDRSYKPPPEFLEELGKRVCKELGHPPQNFTNFIISLYKKGFHLEPHIDFYSDVPHEKGFYFSDKVYGVILETDSEGHLYFIRHEEKSLPPLDAKPVYSLDEKLGTVFCLQGQLRKAPYYHAVSEVRNQRISVTFRKVHFKD